MKWISVKDRLPKKNEEVLFFDKKIFSGYWYDDYEGFKNLGLKIVWQCNCECFGMDHGRETYYPTHWMPLPKYPEEIND